jgi:hypothetical protein
MALSVIFFVTPIHSLPKDLLAAQGTHGIMCKHWIIKLIMLSKRIFAILAPGMLSKGRARTKWKRKRS